ncbi:hypothetical protein JIN85_08065 [Luteolibacter pohnpeiensis]|uniref:F5/8 type C domain-containing protein n=1 Tax=Luteolibacter pohnpeiensis TaxID=454153 RepID=A0A934VVN0_9BACT|nr:basic secretory protein-like protein [Luteolibacter pohnpeiensis]MBK1882365.1 hypothetical protein [Luteolibacter pohnpeiensis]
MNLRPIALLLSGAAIIATPLHAQLKVNTDYSEKDVGFKLKNVPPPAVNDAAADATIKIVAGQGNRGTGGLPVLTDGAMPTDPDEKKSSFCFSDVENGGRLVIDLGKVIAVKTVATYSWSAGSRAGQFYRLYGSDGEAKNFNAAPDRQIDPLTCGWKGIAKVDTRDKPPGQHAAEVTSPRFEGLGKFRYILLEIEQPDPYDPESNTMFNEIDVIDVKGPDIQRAAPGQKLVRTYKTDDGAYSFTVDATLAPDLLNWSEKVLMPVVKEWYPKLVDLLPSKGYTASHDITMVYKPDANVMKGTPAWAAGSELSLNADWFRGQLEGEGCGCVIHELVHVVQDYGRARQTNPNPSPTPGWVTEGTPDYIRFYIYEPKTNGAALSPDRAESVKYDGMYRISANFFNYVFSKYGTDLLQKLNTAAREGKYDDDLWLKWTEHSLDQLNDEWKKSIKRGR